MPLHRRLTAALAAASLGWAVLAVGVTAPVARAAEPTTPTTSAATGERAPHDPATYYAGTEGLSGATLAARLHDIIKGHTKLSYGDLWTAFRTTDPDPANPGNLVDFYSGSTLLTSNQCGSSCPTGGWNREHTWPQSHGNFGTTAGIGTDLFHMRPEFGTTNSSRGNLDFDNTASGTVPNCADCRRDGDSFEPRAAVKGDLARGLFYMAVRYEGDGGELNLKMNDLTCNGSGAANMGKLSTLVSWALNDPVTDAERARNDVIDSDFQHNRNPFIDHPEWVSSIFGTGVGQGPACGSASGTDYVPGGGTVPTNTAPTSTTPTTASTAEDTARTVTLTGSDADGDPLTWSVSQAPSHGTASVSGSVLTYTPAPNFNGTDAVGLTVSDGRGGSSGSTVTFTVTPVNDAPTAGAVTATTARDVSTQIALKGADVDDTALTYVIGTAPAHGTVTVAGATATYTPTGGYAGPDSFTYTVRDPAGATSSAATVSITVTATPRAPTATAGSATTAEDQPVTVTLAGSDPDGDPLTYAIAAQPTHGTVSLSGGNQARYTPAADYHGADAFTFTVRDATTTSAPATVSLTVTPVNDAPVATPATVTTAEDTAATFTLGGTDVDGDALTYALAAQPAHGSVTLDGARVTYLPAADFNGPDAFTFTARDAAVGSAPATVTLTVTPVDDAPSITGDRQLETTAGTPVATTFEVTDPDADETLTLTTTQPEHGTVEVAGTTVTYTPATRSGTESYVVTVTDRTGLTASVTVLVEITARAARLRLDIPAATRGTPTTMTVTATGPTGEPAGPTPSGAVTIEFSGIVLVTTTLGADGTVTVPLTASRAGSIDLVATYAGDALFGPTTSAPATLAVARSASKVGLSAGALERGEKGKVTVAVRTIAGVRATGKVTLTAGSRKLTSTLVKGAATFTIARLPQTARLKVSARYVGDSDYLAGSGSRTFRLTR